MIEKTAAISKADHSTIKEDLEYWLGKTPDERVSAVQYYRRQYPGCTERLQRVVRIIQLSQS